mgnify:CR=1 FL=1
MSFSSRSVPKQQEIRQVHNLPSKYKNTGRQRKFAARRYLAFVSAAIPHTHLSSVRRTNSRKANIIEMTVSTDTISCDIFVAYSACSGTAQPRIRK